MYLVVIDFTMAFDFVSRDAIWRILLNYGTPESLAKESSAFTLHAMPR